MKKRRKTAVIILILSLLLGIGGCAKKQNMIYVSEEEFLSFGATVELNVSNWEEYFEVAPGIVKESFNRSGTYLYQYNYLVPKEFCVISSEQVVAQVEGVSFENNELYEATTGELYQELGIQYEFSKSFSIGDDKMAGELVLAYEDDKSEIWSYPFDGGEKVKCTSVMNAEIKEISCTEIEGTVSSFLIPDEVWNIDVDGVRYLCVGEAENCFRIYEPSFYDDTRRYFKKTGKLGGKV